MKVLATLKAGPMKIPKNHGKRKGKGIMQNSCTYLGGSISVGISSRYIQLESKL